METKKDAIDKLFIQHMALSPTAHLEAKKHSEGIEALEKAKGNKLHYTENLKNYQDKFNELLALEHSKSQDQALGEVKTEGTKIIVTASRKRILTYWGNNNQYEKEEIYVSSSLERTVNDIELLSLVDIADKTAAHLQSVLKRNLDREEKGLPKPEGG